MTNIEKLRNQYYDAILLLQEEQEIIDALPQPEYTNFFQLITSLIERIEKEIDSLEQSLYDVIPSEKEMRDYFEEEISMLSFKKEVCIKLLEKGKTEQKIEEEYEEGSEKNIIFATSESGNICIENDIKTIPEEYYLKIMEILAKLQGGIIENNPEKHKIIKSSNKKMSGIKEIKEFKIRICYKTLSKDTIYVFIIRMKKSDNDAIDRKEIINRSTQRNNQYLELKKQIQDPKIKEKLIEEHAKILADLYEYLEHNKRGK